VTIKNMCGLDALEEPDARDPNCGDADRRLLRTLLIEGASSPPSAAADEAYFEALRRRVLREDASGACDGSWA